MIAISSCSKDKASERIAEEPELCDTLTPSFASDVMPIFQANCVGCHNAANNFANGQNWETHAEIASDTGSILTAIKHEPGKTPMPFMQPKMSDSLIQIIECWIKQGAQDN